VFFLDDLKEEMVTKFIVVKLIMDVKENIIECERIIFQPNVGLVVPWTTTCGMSIAILPGIFARVRKCRVLYIHAFMNTQDVNH